MTARVLQGDALARLRELPSGSVHCIVTSPPYYGLRRYAAGPQEMGSEASPEAYLAAMVAVFREGFKVQKVSTEWVRIQARFRCDDPVHAPKHRSAAKARAQLALGMGQEAVQSGQG